MNKKTVYIPIKIEDELPKELDLVIFIAQVPFNHQFKIFDDGSTTMEFVFKGWLENEKYLIHGLGEELLEGKITHWFKPKESFVFTPKELKQLLKDYTNKIIENIELKERLHILVVLV